MSYRHGIVVLAWLVVVFSLAGRAPAQDLEPLCYIDTPDGVAVDCGTVPVIEDRVTGSGSINIAVMRYRSAHPEAVPVFLLAGGPGQSGIEAFGTNFEERIAPFLESRDVVIFDQRGVGASGALTCAGGASEGGARFDIDFEGAEFAEFFAQTIADCGAQFEADGVNVAAYTSVQSAADIADIAAALGYEQINVYGISYGTRLAQTVMREHADLVNAVVLDSALPTAVNAAEESPAAFNHTLEELFAACTADEACHSAYPDLHERFSQAHELLTEQSVTINGLDPISGEQFPIALNENVFTGIVYNGFYTPITIRLLPAAIAGAAVGDYALLGEVAGYTLSPNSNLAGMLADGLQYAVTCSEEVPFENRETILEAMEAHPRLQYPLYTASQLGERIVDACATWQVREPEPIRNQPVESDIPTLVLGGQFDQITPTYWSEDMVQTLDNAYLYIFPNQSHVTASGDNCPMAMIQDFLRDPSTAPADDCVETRAAIEYEIITFEQQMVEAAAPTPTVEVTEAPPTGDAASGDLEEINMVELEDPAGISVLVPEGWTFTEEGTYVSSGGVVSLTQQAIQAPSPLFVLPVVATQTGLGELGEGIPFTVGDVEWTLYNGTVDGTAFDIAVANEGRVYLVLLAMPEDRRDRLYDEVFIPAVEHFGQ